MLSQLSIRNFVIVSNLDLEFHSGFTVLTGETGAGKSIILDALALLLGRRSDSGYIQSGFEKAELAAQFELPQEHAVFCWLDTHGFDTNTGSIVIRRILDLSGKSRQFINGSVATVSQLRELGVFVLDIHGQHAHQALMSREHQRYLLDAYAQADELASRVAKAWQIWQDVRSKRELAKSEVRDSQLIFERLSWQYDDLSKLNPKDNEWSELSHEHIRLSNANECAHVLQEIIQGLTGDGGVQSQVYAMLQKIASLKKNWPELGNIDQLIHSAWIELREAGDDLVNLSNRIDVDFERLTDIDRRMSDFLGIARKFRLAPESLYEHHQQLAHQLQSFNDEYSLDSLTQEEQKYYQLFLSLAEQLSSVRRVAAINLSKAITESMQSLAMNGMNFAVEISPLSQPNSHGLEQIEFLVSANIGGHLKPLSKVASGGELSRIGLAIQMILSTLSHTPTLIFDEVDAGIGGSVAQIIGESLAKLGKHHQVLCITHLPQVASVADHHWYVEKHVNNNKTESQVIHLDARARVSEIARMLGAGASTNEAAMQHAEVMLASLSHDA
jgi:DNA repair protein RecN (Recombination protein N)